MSRSRSANRPPPGLQRLACSGRTGCSGAREGRGGRAPRSPAGGQPCHAPHWSRPRPASAIGLRHLCPASACRSRTTLAHRGHRRQLMTAGECPGRIDVGACALAHRPLLIRVGAGLERARKSASTSVNSNRRSPSGIDPGQPWVRGPNRALLCATLLRAGRGRFQGARNNPRPCRTADGGSLGRPPGPRCQGSVCSQESEQPTASDSGQALLSALPLLRARVNRKDDSGSSSLPIVLVASI